jgi:hypothetical protein
VWEPQASPILKECTESGCGAVHREHAGRAKSAAAPFPGRHFPFIPPESRALPDAWLRRRADSRPTHSRRRRRELASRSGYRLRRDQCARRCIRSPGAASSGPRRGRGRLLELLSPQTRPRSCRNGAAPLSFVTFARVSTRHGHARDSCSSHDEVSPERICVLRRGRVTRRCYSPAQVLWRWTVVTAADAPPELPRRPKRGERGRRMPTPLGPAWVKRLRVPCSGRSRVRCRGRLRARPSGRR